MDGDDVSPSPNPNPRDAKLRRSGEAHSGVSSPSGGGGSGEDEKRKARLMRNRESAQLSRQRRKRPVEELEDRVRAMGSTIADLNCKISFYMAENARLHHQLTAGGGANPTPPALSHAPVHPAVHSPYARGVPDSSRRGPDSMPIPKLKPQQPAPALKTRKPGSRRSGEGKGRTKKVTGVSLLGLFFEFLMFRGLLNFGFSRTSGGDTSTSGGEGRVLSVSGRDRGAKLAEDIGFKHNSS